MAESQEIELKIHFGGSVKKIGKEDYEYLGELGSKNVEWKFDEILWDRFVDFCKEEALIRAPVGLIWFKSEKEEMKQLRYLYDRYDEEMLMLRSVSKLGIDVVVVFVEHECSEHIPGVIQLSDREHIEDEEHSENDDVDRPKEDDEPEGSEDKNPAEKEDNPTVNPAEKEDNEDGGDEVVADVTDDTNDVRFQSVFEEGEKAVLDKEAYGNGIEEDDSEDERAPVDVEYLDTPKARCAKKHCSTIRSGFSLYEVNEFDCGYMVDLATHQCACRRWDLTGIPCKHAVCVLDDNQEDPSGHIKTGCKNQTVVYEGPKNKRGRPRKNLEDPPSTRRRKTQNTRSSFQHVHATGSSSQSVHVTGSSSQPKPLDSHLTPSLMLRNLNEDLLRKTANIPHGVGTLWSPFTNRPFEVFGDRVYDRSDLNPQPPQE
ncbi:LOW QUALITY PROTEIN: hypothetical protein HID58_084831 [Brassica napus]|uniref:SWIM-type domain-containing protein n=1 Tax=Brassica napus TaxID=3708 RepID=A0ABQ7XKT9_BRANA|nr:LOW QUALITY PROTEIN: hypothetical protein HID58_084831 [Brassica napus]